MSDGRSIFVCWFFVVSTHSMVFFFPFLAGSGTRSFEEEHVATVSGEERFRLEAVAAEGVNPL